MKNYNKYFTSEIQLSLPWLDEPVKPIFEYCIFHSIDYFTGNKNKFMPLRICISFQTFGQN